MEPLQSPPGNPSHHVTIEQLEAKLAIVSGVLPSPQLLAEIRQRLILTREAVNSHARSLPSNDAAKSVVRVVTHWLDDKAATVEELEFSFKYADAAFNGELIKKLADLTRDVVFEGLELLKGFAQVTASTLSESQTQPASPVSTSSYNERVYDIDDLHEKLHRRDIRIEKLEAKLREEEDKNAAMMAKMTNDAVRQEDYIKNLENEWQEMNDSRKADDKTVAKLRAQLQESERENAARKAECESLAEIHSEESRVNKDARIAELQSRLRDYQLEVKQHVERNDALLTDNAHLKANRDRLSAENKTLKSDNAGIKGYYAEVRDELRELTRDLDEHVSTAGDPGDRRISSGPTKSGSDELPVLKAQLDVLLAGNASLEERNHLLTQELMQMRAQIPLQRSPELKPVAEGHLQDDLVEHEKQVESQESRAREVQPQEARAPGETIGDELQAQERVEELDRRCEAMEAELRRAQREAEGMVKLFSWAADVIEELGGQRNLLVREVQLLERGRQKRPQRGTEGWSWFALASSLFMLGMACYYWKEIQFWRDANGMAMERYLAGVLGGAHY